MEVVNSIRAIRIEHLFQECAEYGGTGCTGPTWTKLVPIWPSWTNLAKLVVILLYFAFDQLGPSQSSTLSHSIPCTPDYWQGNCGENLANRICRWKSGQSKQGLSKRGLGPKGANWAKKAPFGAISPLPPWLWGEEELGPMGPHEPRIGPGKGPIGPERARFPPGRFPPILSENLGLNLPLGPLGLHFIILLRELFLVRFTSKIWPNYFS